VREQVGQYVQDIVLLVMVPANTAQFLFKISVIHVEVREK
jgi:hypothetical protein